MTNSPRPTKITSGVAHHWSLRLVSPNPRGTTLTGIASICLRDGKNLRAQPDTISRSSAATQGPATRPGRAIRGYHLTPRIDPRYNTRDSENVFSEGGCM